MSKSNPTPEDLAIHPRDRAFFRGQTNPRHWQGGDPVATAFYNALSATFPLGERFFMDAVRRFAHLAPPRLKAEISAFTMQEAVHSREHVFFNNQVAGYGYDMAEMQARTQARVDFARTRPPIAQLAATVALEHFTAILAHAALSDPRHFENAGDEARAMWTWHAIEEVEHKAVAFDTFMLAAARLPATRRWLLRATAMMFATTTLLSTVMANMTTMFRADGIDNASTWLRVAGFLFGRPGIFRQVFIAYLSFYRPGFHPWEVDDRSLIAAPEAAFAAA